MEATALKGRCDICNEKDKFHGFNLQRCKSCGVAVHEQCYGAIRTKGKNPDWECMVCRIAEGGNTGQLECALCSVSHSIHAMHPLYDTHGRRGKQLVIGGKKAWVHTLCASFVGTNESTAGTVYGCTENGHYEGEGSEPMQNNDATESSTSDDGDAKPREKKGVATKEWVTCEVHHYVICDAKVVSPWATAICESQKLKCILCGHKDNKVNCFRIPVQCSRNTCFVAMHVGCARWKPTPRDGDPPYQRISFFPGNKIDKPRCNAFCDLHSQDIKNNKKREKAEMTSAAPSSSQHRKKIVGDHPTHNAYATDPIRRNSLTKTPPATSTATTNAATATKSYSEELFETILQDVVKRIRNAKKSKNNEKLTNVTAEAKEYWKKKAHLPDKTFKALWSDVRKGTVKIIESDKVPATKNDGKAEEEKQQPEPMDIDQETTGTPNTVAPVMDLEQNPNPWAKYWMPYCQDFIQFEWKEE